MITEKNELVGQTVLLRLSDPYELSMKLDFDFRGEILAIRKLEETEILIAKVSPGMEDSWGNSAEYLIAIPRWLSQHVKDLATKVVVVNFSGLKKWPLLSDEIIRQHMFGIGCGTIRQSK